MCESHSNRLRNNGYTIFDGKDFGMDKLVHLCPNLLFEKLVVCHVCVDDKCTKAEVDLDEVIQRFSSV